MINPDGTQGGDATEEIVVSDEVAETGEFDEAAYNALLDETEDMDPQQASEHLFNPKEPAAEETTPAEKALTEPKSEVTDPPPTTETTEVAETQELKSDESQNDIEKLRSKSQQDELYIKHQGTEIGETKKSLDAANARIAELEAQNGQLGADPNFDLEAMKETLGEEEVNNFRGLTRHEIQQVLKEERESAKRQEDAITQRTVNTRSNVLSVFPQFDEMKEEVIALARQEAKKAGKPIPENLVETFRANPYASTDEATLLRYGAIVQRQRHASKSTEVAKNIDNATKPGNTTKKLGTKGYEVKTTPFGKLADLGDEKAMERVMAIDDPEDIVLPDGFVLNKR